MVEAEFRSDGLLVMAAEHEKNYDEMYGTDRGQEPKIFGGIANRHQPESDATVGRRNGFKPVSEQPVVLKTTPYRQVEEKKQGEWRFGC